MRKSLKDYLNLPKDSINDPKTKKLIKNLSISLQNVNSNNNENEKKINNEINDKISKILSEKKELFTNSKDSFDIKIFLFIVLNEFERQLKLLLENVQIIDLENPKQISSFLNSFYDFYEEELVINSEDIKSEIIKSEKISDSFVVSLNKILNTIFKYEQKENLMALFQKETEFYDIGIYVLQILYYFYTIHQNIYNNIFVEHEMKNKNNDILYLNKVKEYAFNPLKEFFISVILEYNLKFTMTLVTKKNEFSYFFTELSYYSDIRKHLYNIINKNLYSESLYKQIIKYLEENKCLEGILLKIKILYEKKEYKNINEILNEIKILFNIKLIVIAANNNHNNNHNNYETFVKKIIKFLTVIFSDINKINKENFNFEQFQIFFEELITSTQKNKSKTSLYEIINFLLDIFEDVKKLRNTISNLILNNLNKSLHRYKNLLEQTNFKEKFIYNLYNCEQDLISYYFLFLFNFIDTYLPITELEIIIKSIYKCKNKDNVSSIIKNLKIFNEMKSINISSIEDLNCLFLDVTFNIIKEVANKIKKNPNDSNNVIITTINNNNNILLTEKSQKSTFSMPMVSLKEMIMEMLNYAEEFMANSDKVFNYFFKLNFNKFFNDLHLNSEYMEISYKIITIVINLSKEQKIVEENLKFIHNRTKDLKDIYENKINNNENNNFLSSNTNTTNSNNNKNINNENEEKKSESEESENNNENDIKNKPVITEPVKTINNTNLLTKQDFKIISTELIFCYKIFQIFFEKEKFTSTNFNKMITENIFSFSLFLSENSNELYKDYNLEIHDNIKIYINIIFKIIYFHNSNVINRNNFNCPIITEKNLKNIVYDLFEFYYKMTEFNKNYKDYFLDIIKYLIDKSLNFKFLLENNNDDIDADININSNDNYSNIHFDENFVDYYKKKFDINSNDLNKFSNLPSNYSNFCIQNSLMFILMLKSFLKINKFLKEYLNFLFFICQTSDGNIKLLLKHKFVQILFKVYEKYKNDKNVLELLNKIFSIVFKFLDKENVRIVFYYMFKLFNNNNNFNYDENDENNFDINTNKPSETDLKFVKIILKALLTNIKSTSNFPKKELVLTNFNIHQLNIYNSVKIFNNNFNTSEKMITFIMRIGFFNYDEQIPFHLLTFKLENKVLLEIFMKQTNLTIKEFKGEGDEINTKEFLRFNDVNIFKFVFDLTNNKLTIFLNTNNIINFNFSFSFNEENIQIFIGYKYNNLKDLYNDKFVNFSHVKIHTFKILTDQANSNIIYDLFGHSDLFINKKNFELFLDNDTIVNAKYSCVESIKQNSILNRNNIVNQIKLKCVFLGSCVSYSISTISFEKLIFMLLIENIDGEIFNLLSNLLIHFIDLTNSQMFQKNDVFSVFYFSMFKNIKFIDKDIIRDLYKITTINNNNNKIITNFFLDKFVFENFNDEQKMEILNLVRKKIELDSYQLNFIIIDNIINILFLVENNDDVVDSICIEIMIRILEMFNNNKKILDIFDNFLYITLDFEKNVNFHLDFLKLGKETETKKIINDFFVKLISGRTLMIRDKIFKHIKTLETLNENSKKFLLKFSTDEIKQQTNENNIIKFSNTITNDNNRSKKKHFSQMKIKNVITNNINYNEHENINSGIISPKRNNRRSSFFSKKSKKLDAPVTPKAININNNGVSLAQNQNDVYVLRGTIGGNDENNTWVNFEVNHNNGFNRDGFEINLDGVDKIICTGNCQLCFFIRTVIKKIFKRHKLFNAFKTFMAETYTNIFINDNKIKFNWTFSNYLVDKEGPSRIKNKFKIKPDLILNDEIDRNNKNYKNSEFLNKFNFFDFKTNLFYFFNLQQIFSLDIEKNLIDDDDQLENLLVYNCLLFDKMNYINSVVILGVNKIYIMTNVVINKMYTMFYSNQEINKIFWVANDYDEILNRYCEYLNFNFDDDDQKEKIYTINENQTMGDVYEKKNVFKRFNKGIKFFSFCYPEINELHKKKFLHQDNAIEIFLKNGKNFFIAFNVNNRDNVVSNIMKNFIAYYNKRKKNMYINNNNGNSPVNSNNNENANFEIANYSTSSLKNPNMIFISDIHLFNKKKKINLKEKSNSNKNQKFKKFKKKKSAITEIKSIMDKAYNIWTNGFMTTYDYIMLLNSLAGRTYNDLAQYPIFPWVLSDYTSPEINLIDEKSYRNFLYPIYAQNEATRNNLKERFDSTEEKELKYHSGSHYSNPAFVCYYLIRVKPYSFISSEIQGGCFDTPDRLFFNIKNFYIVNEKYQELIPDVFNLPELFINTNKFNFGVTTENVKVDNVLLPNWALNSPRFFSKMLKKSLETEIVSLHINHWIDLIFGYKQTGSNAVESFNILREICSHFDPNSIKDKDEIEQKISELCEMGINPIQLFNKPHAKRERHQKIKEFFGKSGYLQYFKPKDKDKEFKIKNFFDGKICEIHKYYEYTDKFLSKGEGGLSSFKICYEECNPDEEEDDNNNNNNIYFFIGEDKTLLPPTFKNYIDYSKEHSVYGNTLSIIKPYKGVKYLYNISHMKSFKITYVKCSIDGKIIIIGYNNGVIEKYRLKKIKNENVHTNELNYTFSINNNSTVTNSYRNSMKSTNTLNNINTIQEKNDETKKKKSSIFGKLLSVGKNVNKFVLLRGNSINRKKNASSSQREGVPNDYEDIQTSSSTGINNKKNFCNTFIDRQFNVNFANITNSSCSLLNNLDNNFIQYSPKITFFNVLNNNIVKNYFAHSTNANQIKYLNKNSSNNNMNENISNVYLLFINSTNIILNSILLIEVLETYSMLIVVDIKNMIYIFDYNSFILLRIIDYDGLFGKVQNKKIKVVDISCISGDFLASTSENCVLFNINGVPLAKKIFETKINCCCIKTVVTTESDIHLFTGDKNGNLIIYRLKNYYEDILTEIKNDDEENKNKHKFKTNNNIIEPYFQFYNNEKIDFNDGDVKLIYSFEYMINIKCSNSGLEIIKLSEDLTKVICVNEEKNIIYLTYEEYFENKKKSNKKTKNVKVCPVCDGNISNSKILCHVCGKKICPNCAKDKVILPEYSLKNKKSICEDCKNFTKRTNKMLYDF